MCYRLDVRAFNQSVRGCLAVAKCRFRRALSRWSCFLLSTPVASWLPAPLAELGLEARVIRAMRRGDPAQAIWGDLSYLQHQYCNHTIVHRLLFRRGFRPSSFADQVWLFDAIAADPQMPESHRAYALVSLGYCSLKNSDCTLAARLQPQIEAMLQALEADPGTLRCPRGNRRNRLKLLVSSLTVFSHLQLLLADRPGLKRSCEKMLTVLEQLSWADVPADVAYRLLTNASRVVGLGALLAWREHSLAHWQRSLAMMNCLQTEANAERYLGSTAQEDHRGTVSNFYCALQGLEVGPSTQALTVAFGLLNVRTPALQDQLELLLR